MFRKIPGREAFMQALPLEIKRNLKVIDIEIVPLQTDTEPNDYSNRFQSDKGTIYSHILFVMKRWKSYTHRRSHYKDSKEQNSIQLAEWSFM